jgi:hypothetical protein
MTDSLYKFGSFAASGTEEAFHYGNTWARDTDCTPQRLVIAPASGHISLLRSLMDVMRDPFGVLYVLVVPRSQLPGRYECPSPTSRGDAISFFQAFGDFFEHDGRCNVWLGAFDSSSLLVYDRHNVLYAYGPLDEFVRVLNAMGYTEVSKITFPAPHAHHYHPELDAVERQLLKYWEWKHFPLQPGDES